MREGRAWLFTFVMTVVSRGLSVRDSLLRVTRRLKRQASCERFFFASGERRLEGVWVRPAEGAATLLICHGIGETVGLWSGVQAMLRERGVGSLVFDYSGYGRSSGSIRVEHFAGDLRAAYGEVRLRVGGLAKVFLLGFSLGSGVAAAGAGELMPPVAGLFLCEAYSSFREAARAAGAPGWLVRLAPDAWDTLAAVREVKCPVCVVHSDADRLFPLEMGERIAEACGGYFVVVRGYAHDGIYLRAEEGYWGEILRRIV